MSPETEPEAQLRLFPLDPPKRIKGQRRVIPTYSDEQRVASRAPKKSSPGSGHRHCRLTASSAPGALSPLGSMRQSRWSCLLARPHVPSTRTQKGVGAASKFVAPSTDS